MIEDMRRFIRVDEWPRGSVSVPRIQAHRGYCQSGAVENTLAAFREARQQGALMVETDVRLTHDQVPVLFHDQDLQRLAGEPRRLHEITLTELRQSFTEATTLQELLQDNLSPRLVNIELKSKAVVEDALERKTAEVVKAAKATRRVLFSSFNPFSLYRISLHLPEVPRALLVSSERTADNSILLRKMFLAPFCSFHLLHLEQQMVTAESMNFWHRRNIPVSVWTVNGKVEVEKFLRLRCLSVISDKWS